MINMYHSEDKEYERESNFWITCYMTFNDNNPIHADNSFHNTIVAKNIDTAEELHIKNLQWISSFLEDMTEEYILKYLPEAISYITELRSKDYYKEFTR